MNKIVKNNIKAIRDARGMDVDTFARMIYRSSSHVQTMQRQTTKIKEDLLERICSALQCDVDDIYNENFLANEFVAKKPFHEAVIDKKKAKEFLSESDWEAERRNLTIPMYNEYKAGAGHGVIQGYIDTDDFMSIPIAVFMDMVGIKGVSNEAIKNGRYKFIQVNGDSMEPYIMDNAVILMDTSYSSTPFDEVVSYRKCVYIYKNYADELLVKEISRDIKGLYSIVSYNESYDSPKNLSLSEVSSEYVKEIIGKVIWHGERTSYFKPYYDVVKS